MDAKQPADANQGQGPSSPEGPRISAIRVLAGMVQAMATVCLVVAFWRFVVGDASSQDILVLLGFAGVLQLMTITFYLMGPS